MMALFGRVPPCQVASQLTPKSVQLHAGQGTLPECDVTVPQLQSNPYSLARRKIKRTRTWSTGHRAPPFHVMAPRRSSPRNGTQSLRLKPGTGLLPRSSSTSTEPSPSVVAFRWSCLPPAANSRVPRTPSISPPEAVTAAHNRPSRQEDRHKAP
jgi:hypothetical protein